MLKKDYIQSLKSMIESCFAYGGCSKDSFNFNKYILPKEKELGKKLFKKIYNETIKELENCTIEHDTYTDHEGCTYNSIIRN
jgi:hypothetical protein